MKKYPEFIKENLAQVQTERTIQYTTFDKLEPKQLIRLFSNGKNIGIFRIDATYDTVGQYPGFDTIVVHKLNNDVTETNSVFTIKYTDKEYTFQVLQKRHSVGIVFIYNSRILLVHHTDRSKSKGYTHPKGGALPGEKLEVTANREVKEEIGVDFPIELLKGPPKHLEYFTWDSLKVQYFFIVELNKELFKRYFNTKTIPKENLLLNEIDWAGFVPIKDCKPLLQENFEKLLSFLPKIFTTNNPYDDTMEN